MPNPAVDVTNSMVLVVEDQTSIADTIVLYLKNNGFKYKHCSSAELAQTYWLNQPVDLVLLDIMLPGNDGFWLLEQFRSRPLPVILLTAKTTEDDIIAGLEHGAIDYITKPFKPRELMARITTHLRQARHFSSGLQSNTAVSQITAIGQLQLDPVAMQASLAGQPISLTKTEYDLLYCFMQHPNAVLTRGQLISHVFGHLYEGNERTLDTHLYNLRKKFETNPQRPDYIHTIHGIGYKFQYHRAELE